MDVMKVAYAKFQSTLPAGGSDNFGIGVGLVAIQFQSTLPAGGSDTARVLRIRQLLDFNPRFPRGEATSFMNSAGKTWKFQSTLPAGGSDAAAYHRKR